MNKRLFSLAIVAVSIVFYWFFYRPLSDVSELQLEAIRGKRVLITGASSGIGEELAYAYSRLGAIVLLSARRESLLKDVAEKCRSLGAERVEYVTADMALAKDRQTLMIEAKMGLQNQLDYLVLNHAIFVPGPFEGGVQNMTGLQRELQVNFVSFVDIAARCQKMLLTSKDGGHIGVVSSSAGKLALPLLASYAADKHALHGFFSSWRQELRARRTPISITLFVLGTINTDAAAKVMDSHFPHVAAMELEFPSAEATASAILKGLVRGDYEVYYPTSTSILVTISKFIPGYIDDFLASTLL